MVDTHPADLDESPAESPRLVRRNGSLDTVVVISIALCPMWERREQAKYRRRGPNEPGGYHEVAVRRAGQWSPSPAPALAESSAGRPSQAKERMLMDRKIIAALQVSLDGLIEGPEAEVDWIDNWDDPFEVLPEIDTCIVGGGMYPGYEQYWRSILANPTGVQPLTGRSASEEEVAYARFADRTPHLVLSRTLDAVTWKSARIARDVEEIHRLKQQPGKNIHAVGGATLVSSLLNEGLIDEIRLTVHPLVLGQGKPLFKDVRDRHALDLVDSRRLSSGRVNLIYRGRT